MTSQKLGLYNKKMEYKTTLNVLGCVPALLNVLFELADDARGIKAFNILKNIPVEIAGHFAVDKTWKVKYIDTNKSSATFNPEAFYALSVVGTKSKELVYNTFKELIQMEDKQFINLIHPTSYVSRSVRLNYGLQLEPLSTIAACSSIGFSVNVKRNCNIGHHCNIGDFVTINPGVTLSSFVEIGANTMIGSGVSVKDHINIGKNSIIGVGSVVVKDIPDNSIAYGNPCIVHKTNFKNEDNKK